MSMQDTKSHQTIGTRRMVLTGALIFLLGFSGLLTITVAHGASNVPAVRRIAYPNAAWSMSYPGSQPGAKLIPRATPSPAGPLPPTLPQAIATLRAQNRLLYMGNTSLPEIALTFEDGPNPYYTPSVLNILPHYHVQATFFCIGRLVAAYPQLVRQEFAAGYTIGNHSWSHPNMALLAPAAVQFQISRASDAIEAAIGVRPTFFRPPYGAMSVQLLTQVYYDGLTAVIWNDEARDWSRPGVDVIIQRILGLARNGAIILLHDGGGDRSQTVAALPVIIAVLKARGFQFVTIPQMLANLHQPKSIASGSLPPTNIIPSPLILSAAWRRGQEI
jgi:peptidoglycan-N-acetylglucosamine deacetylase